MSNTELLNKIDAAIAEKNLLKHPFYQDWQAGKLSRESLQLYAAQYYRHVEAFPKHLRVLAARADETLKPTVLENLAEEEIRTARIHNCGANLPRLSVSAKRTSWIRLPCPARSA
jgi:pyrroloquinoline quinone (PQQ) biosynthesis protein C